MSEPPDSEASPTPRRRGTHPPSGGHGQRISICAWCGTPTTSDPLPAPDPSAPASAPSTPIEHGICTRCVAELGAYPIERLVDFDRERYDALPFGVIQVDRDGRVLTYNRWEQELAGRTAAQVLGRNFFREVAPCTGVADFEGRFRQLVAHAAPARDSFDFLFRFPGGDVLVSVALAWAPSWQRCYILVRRASE